MNQENQFATFDDTLVAAQAPVDARVAFLKRTYGLLLAAILLFAGTMWFAAQPGPVREMANSLLGVSPWLYLGVVIGGLVVGFCFKQFCQRGRTGVVLVAVSVADHAFVVEK